MTFRAYHSVIFPDGSIRRLVVIHFDNEGRYSGYHLLKEEEPFVEWRGGTLDLRQ